MDLSGRVQRSGMKTHGQGIMGLLRFVLGCEIVSQIWTQILSTMMSMFFLACIGIMMLIKGRDFINIKPRPSPPPLISDPKWGIHSYMTLKLQGLRLHYVEKGDRNKPLLVCVHGFPECWFAWRNQLEHLSKKYWVVAVDMRGYGDSDKPSGTSAYAITHLVEDLRQFILGLGKEKCTIMAHDWGGVIAWLLVAKYPELFNHHISCNGPHPGVFKRVIDNSWKQKFRSWYMIFFQTPWVPELLIGTDDLSSFNNIFGKPCPDEVEVFKYYLSQKGALTPPINYYRANSIRSGLGMLPQITVPTLIIWGTDDLALSKEMATMAGEECEKSVVKFVEGATHWVQQEEPEIVNSIILEYLAVQTS